MLIDQIQPIEIAESDLDKLVPNEFGLILRTWVGLDYLSKFALRFDDLGLQVHKRVDSEGRALSTNWSWGNDDSGVNLHLLTCVYNWYAVSACDMVRTIGHIAIQCGAAKDFTTSKQYSSFVIPEVLDYRDKVGAHNVAALVGSPTSKFDNHSERVASTISNVSWENDKYVAGNWQIAHSSGTESSDSSKIRRWSICEVHQRLIERYGEAIPTPRS